MGNTHIHFIRPVAQHPHLNPVYYKICAEMQQRVYLKNVHNVYGLTLWHVWHGFESRIRNNVTDDWHKRIKCVKMSREDFLSIYDSILYTCIFESVSLAEITSELLFLC